MQQFSFVHTADWHVGRGFSRFAEGIADQLRRARIGAIDRIAETARSNGARHVLVAGDIYDRDGIADRQVRAPALRMAAAHDLTWHVIPGNHDPDVKGGLWDRLRSIGVPHNVNVYTRCQAVEIEADCWLLPAAGPDLRHSRDPTAWMADAATPDGALRIGLAHGSVEGLPLGDAADDQGEIAANAAVRAGLDYLALGDWHGMHEAGARSWYAGTPEPDRFKDNASGHVLSVGLAPGTRATVTPHRVAKHNWLTVHTFEDPSDALAALNERVGALGSDAMDALVELKVSGALDADAYAVFQATVDRLEATVLSVEVRDEGLNVRFSEDALAGAFDDEVADVARALADRQDGPDGATAQRALRLLVRLAEAGTARDL